MNYGAIRKKTKKLKVGSIYIGGDTPVSVQSMTNTNSDDFEATEKQIRELSAAGCDIVRLTVPDMEAVKTVYRLKESGLTVPLVADIHFDYRLACEAVAAGIDKIRINPGNIGDNQRIRAVVDSCRAHNVPIRIGVNGGSLEKDILKKYGSPSPLALAKSAERHIAILESFDFENIIVSIKSSDVETMVKANRIISEKYSYPLHLGLTEAGTPHFGILKSSAAIGSLLADGIGDTVRVSLTAQPKREVAEGIALLEALGVRNKKVNLISCPTCGRTKINLIEIAEEFEKRIAKVDVPENITVAIMGCAVNGPGEASGADIGIAGGDGCAVLFKHGEIVGKIDENAIIETLVSEILKLKNV